MLRRVVLVEVKASIFGAGRKRLEMVGLDKPLEKQDDC